MEVSRLRAGRQWSGPESVRDPAQDRVTVRRAKDRSDKSSLEPQPVESDRAHGCYAVTLRPGIRVTAQAGIRARRNAHLHVGWLVWRCGAQRNDKYGSRCALPFAGDHDHWPPFRHFIRQQVMPPCVKIAEQQGAGIRMEWKHAPRLTCSSRSKKCRNDHGDIVSTRRGDSGFTFTEAHVPIGSATSLPRGQTVSVR